MASESPIGKCRWIWGWFRQDLLKASFECFRFFRSENRDVDTSVLKNCSRRLCKLKIWNYVTIFSFSNRNDSNCESEEISSVFQVTMFESNLKIDVTNLKPHASRTHLKIWRGRDSNMLFWTSENKPIFWTSDFQIWRIWRIWSTQTRPLRVCMQQKRFRQVASA